MSLQSGSSLGVIAEPIIDPRKLQVVAYHVTGPRISEPSVLHTSDVREVGPMGLIVDSADSIMTLSDDLIRLQEVIDFRFYLLGIQVVDEHKNRLGKVVEYTLETDGFFVQKLHLSQSLMKNLKASSLLIHRSQIIEVTNSKIIVQSGAIKDRVGLTQVLNPFRKTSSSLAAEAVHRHPEALK